MSDSQMSTDTYAITVTFTVGKLGELDDRSPLS